MSEHIKLSPREVQILELTAKGLCCKLSARELKLELYTVRQHRKSLMQKLGARTIAHAVAVGIQYNIISPTVVEGTTKPPKRIYGRAERRAKQQQH